eukprot:1156488-Pelagomonas_calceolata.AAC.3
MKTRGLDNSWREHSCSMQTPCVMAAAAAANSARHKCWQLQHCCAQWEGSPPSRDSEREVLTGLTRYKDSFYIIYVWIGRIPRLFPGGAGLRIFVTKVGTCDGYKFITEVRIGSDEFGTG